jgi:hypothetical protein
MHKYCDILRRPARTHVPTRIPRMNLDASDPNLACDTITLNPSPCSPCGSSVTRLSPGPQALGAAKRCVASPRFGGHAINFGGALGRGLAARPLGERKVARRSPHNRKRSLVQHVHRRSREGWGPFCSVTSSLGWPVCLTTADQLSLRCKLLQQSLRPDPQPGEPWSRDGSLSTAHSRQSSRGGQVTEALRKRTTTDGGRRGRLSQPRHFCLPGHAVLCGQRRLPGVVARERARF